MTAVVAQLDEEGVLADVSGNTLELKRLEASPSEEVGVGGSEFPETLCEVLVNVGSTDGLLHAGDLARGVLAYRFV